MILSNLPSLSLQTNKVGKNITEGNNRWTKASLFFFFGLNKVSYSCPFNYKTYLRKLLLWSCPVIHLCFTKIPTVSFSDGVDGKESACNAGDLGSIPGLGRCPGGGHGNPLQCSCLENHHGQRSLVGYSSWGCKDSYNERLSSYLNNNYSFINFRAILVINWMFL